MGRVVGVPYPSPRIALTGVWLVSVLYRPASYLTAALAVAADATVFVAEAGKVGVVRANLS